MQIVDWDSHSKPKSRALAWLLPVLVMALALSLRAGESADHPCWLGPDGAPLPFRSHQEAEEFLEEARIIHKQRVGSGINNPVKVLLERDNIQAHAIFRDVAVEKRQARFRNGVTVQHFRDNALFEIAAYRLSRLLGLEGVPPTVERKLGYRRGSLQLWIEKAVSEKGRVKRKILPKDLTRWRVQMQHLYFFDNLVANRDRNQGNILLDTWGRVWMVDHTRAFTRDGDLASPGSFYQIEHGVWRRLLELEQETLRKELRRYLHREELAALWSRRNQIVQEVERLIVERGEALVLLDPLPTPAMQEAARKPGL